MIAKRIISVSAAALLALGVLPAAAFAADTEAATVKVIVENNTLSKDKGAAWSGVLIETEVPLKADSDMLTVVCDALTAEGKTYELSSWGGFDTVADLNGSWMLTLNDWFTTEVASSYTVANGGVTAGDVIDVQYTLDWGSDIGSDWLGTDTSLSALTVSAGTLDKEFSPEVTEYTLTLSGVSEVSVLPTALNKNFQVRTYKNEYAPESSADYRRGDAIEVVDGDKLIIGCGDPAWPSTNYGQTETVYTLNIVSDITGDALVAAKEVEELIDAIGEVTLENEKTVTDAETAYLRLNDTQKQLVGNADVLEAAVAKLKELKKKEVDASFNKMFEETAEKLSETEPAIGAEWKMIGLARAGKLSEKSKAAFAKALAEYAKTAKDGKLNDRRSTENSKESVAAAALGYDPTKYAGTDMLTAVKDEDFTSIQGITGDIWANIALTGVGAEGVHTADLLDAQLESGAFSFDGQTEDVDITAMCITALAGDESTADAVAKAVEWLSSKQGEDGSYGNCESTAQVMIALSSAGINGAEDERFIKNGVSLMDGIAAYYLGSGEFAHLKGGTADSMSTEQAFLALTSYYRLTNNMSAIYDFTADKLVPYTEEEGSNPPTGAAAGMVMILLAGAAAAASRKRK
ncbi:MAG: hypothetical protein IKP95_03800 [Ruminococcus sp.]|nr:hypothetical protein [Ruminococcus sp.]